MLFLFGTFDPSSRVSESKTLFLRYLKPSGDSHLESPEPATNTSSSGRGEDEGETSGATSGEDVWGTPTSGGEFEEEIGGENSTISVSQPQALVDI